MPEAATDQPDVWVGACEFMLMVRLLRVCTLRAFVPVSYGCARVQTNALLVLEPSATVCA
jgi:hypothetical protein